jgi:hypothetical protein
MVHAYEPVIRQIHNAVDLSDTVSDVQLFLSDMIKMSKIPPPSKDGETSIPTVGDFVQLLKKHQYSVHKFIHQCCKNGTELTGWYLDWVKAAAAKFKRDPADDPTVRDAGHLTTPLTTLFFSLPATTQAQILPILDAQAHYIDEMHAASANRLDAVLKSQPSRNPAIAKVLSSSAASSYPASSSGTPDGSRAVTPVVPDPEGDYGPGAYLARWQDLLDSTPITPLGPTGKVGTNDGAKLEAGTKPDVKIVVETLGGGFRALLAEREAYW